MVERDGQTPRVSIPLDPDYEAEVWAYAEDIEDEIGERPDYFEDSGGYLWFYCLNMGQADNTWIYLRADQFPEGRPW